MSDADQPDDDRLDDLGERIAEARRTAEDADVLVDEDEPTFADSGDRGSGEDDQTIAPPG